jgi:ribosomal protein L11 methyltransferase
MIWVWLKLSSVKWMDAWEERFYGNESAVITLLKGGSRLRIEVYNETEKEARELADYWGGSVRKLVNEDWVAKSAVVKPPLKIRDRVVVTMEGDGEGLTKLREDFRDRVVISVPPEMAFGTGDHPTTANCLRLLVEEAKTRKEPWDFLDLGTGSGLLAIAARHLGAGEVVAMDYDEAAIAVARRNCERNGLPLADEKLRVETGDIFAWEAGRRFEVVVANLFSDVLIAAMPRIGSWILPGGTLIVSGILNEQWPAVKAAGETEGVTFGEPLVRGKWTTCRGQMRGSSAADGN